MFLEVGHMGWLWIGVSDESPHQRAGVVALRLREQIIVVLAVRVGAEVWMLALLPDNANVAFLSGCRVHGEEFVLASIDLGNGSFSCHSPTIRRGVGDVPDVGYVLVWTVVVRFVYAGNLVFSHMWCLSKFVNLILISQNGGNGGV
jgi:hypothetical protein